MLKIERSTGMVIAEDLRASIKAIDNALMQETRLTGSLLEASQQIGLPIAHSQKLLEGMARGFEKLVSGRADMLAVVRQVNTIKGQSTQHVVDYGCAGGFDPDGDGVTGSLKTPAKTEAPRVDA